MNKYLRKTLTIFIFIGVLFLLTGCRKGDTGARPIEGFTGLFDIFVYPMAGLMWLVGKACLGNYALAILFTTIIVRTLAWPIYAKTTDLSLKMQLAQPEIDRINQKYQAIGASKDPQTRQRMSLELRQVYKKHGIGIGGCLLPLLQFPIFIGFFDTLYRIPVTFEKGGWAGRLFTNHMIGSIDLFKGREGSTIQLWGIIILAILVGLTQIFTVIYSQYTQRKQKQTVVSDIPEYRRPKQSDKQKSQAIIMNVMMYGMSIMMVVFVVLRPAALGFYWLVGNIYSSLQQILSTETQEKRKRKMEEKLNKKKEGTI